MKILFLTFCFLVVTSVSYAGGKSVYPEPNISYPCATQVDGIILFCE